MTEREKMTAGEWYDANFDPELTALRERAEERCYAFNHVSPGDKAARTAALRALFPNLGKDVVVLAPCLADYGTNCFIGEGTFINHGAYLMDGAKIVIGAHCFIGPNFGCYTAEHAFDVERRNRGQERARPISIGANCWLGGDVKVMPGVTIGEGAVIGAGSVVTKDVPPFVVAAGNPCRVLRLLSDGGFRPDSRPRRDVTG